MTILILLLLLFSATSITLGWFCYKLTNRMIFLSENLDELYNRLDEFDEHVNFIYELEMYYGDETLKNLIRHSRDLRNYMKSYKNIIEMSNDETENIDNEDSNDDDEDEDSSENEEKSTRTGKTVFYQGS